MTNISSWFELFVFIATRRGKDKIVEWNNNSLIGDNNGWLLEKNGSLSYLSLTFFDTIKWCNRIMKDVSNDKTQVFAYYRETVS